MGKTSRDKRDIYYRRAKEEGWRARSAFKLLQIDQQYMLFKGVKKAVDLCAAPGSWSQVLARELNKTPDEEAAKIVAVDLQPMAPIPGVHQLQGDITLKSTADAVIACFEGDRADLVVCDGAPDVTGLHEMDEYMQAQLLLAALNITLHTLKPGGTFVAKMFRGFSTPLIYAQMKCVFEDVVFCKPASSRNSSYECFVVARYLNLPNGFHPQALTDFIESGFCADALKSYGKINQELVPFLALGDMEGFDSEMTYEVDELHEFLEPVQPPIAPPYKEAVEQQRGADK